MTASIGRARARPPRASVAIQQEYTLSMNNTAHASLTHTSTEEEECGSRTQVYPRSELQRCAMPWPWWTHPYPQQFGAVETPATAANQTRIACLGDSLTAGHGASSARAAYPGALQRLLGSAYHVTNMGTPATTALIPERFSSGLLQGNPGGNPSVTSLWTSPQFDVFVSSTWDLTLLMVSALCRAMPVSP